MLHLRNRFPLPKPLESNEPRSIALEYVVETRLLHRAQVTMSIKIKQGHDKVLIAAFPAPKFYVHHSGSQVVLLNQLTPLAVVLLNVLRRLRRAFRRARALQAKPLADDRPALAPRGRRRVIGNVEGALAGRGWVQRGVDAEACKDVLRGCVGEGSVSVRWTRVRTAGTVALDGGVQAEVDPECLGETVGVVIGDVTDLRGGR